MFLFKNVTEDSGRFFAENLREVIANSKWHSIHQDLRVTARFGVAETIVKDDFDSLFKRADKALYRAKEAGRNQVVATQLGD